MCMCNNPTAIRLPAEEKGMNKAVTGEDLLQVLVNLEAVRDEVEPLSKLEGSAYHRGVLNTASYAIEQIADLLGIDVEKENEVN